MMRRVALPLRKPQAVHTARLIAGAGISHFHNSMMAAFAAVTMTILSVLSTAAAYRVRQFAAR